MDKKIPKETAGRLLANATAALGQWGLGMDATTTPEPGTTPYADANLRITHGAQEARYIAEIRRTLTPQTLGPTLMQLKGLGPNALLVTDYVTPPLAERLRQEDVQFIDTAGNAYLRQPHLLVWVTGRKPAARLQATEAGRAFQANGLQILLALLDDPEAINRPYRVLATMAGVAHGTVGNVLKDLARLGFVEEPRTPRGKRRLHHRAKLLDQWTDAYVRTLRPRTLLARYYAPAIENWMEWDLAAHGAVWGGEPAGALLTQYLKPGELTIYADAVPNRLAAMHRLAREAEVGRAGVVEFRRRFWKDDRPGQRTTPPVLAYADLVATGEARCLETARILREQHLDRLLGQD